MTPWFLCRLAPFPRPAAGARNRPKPGEKEKAMSDTAEAIGWTVTAVCAAALLVVVTIEGAACARCRTIEATKRHAAEVEALGRALPITRGIDRGPNPEGQ